MLHKKGQEQTPPSFAPQGTTSRQGPVGNLAQTEKNPGRWSGFGNFKGGTKDTQDSIYRGRSVKKRSGTATTPTKSKTYEL